MKKLLAGLQKIGGALMLPIAVLPIAGLLLRLGQPDLLGFASIAAAGDAIFANLGILFAVGVAIVLGAAHALQPGHGKTIVAAYLVGSRGTAKHALFLGGTVTATHTAGVYALGIVTLFLSQYILPERLSPILACLDNQIEDVEPLTPRRRLGHRQVEYVKASQRCRRYSGDLQKRAIGPGRSRAYCEISQSQSHRRNAFRARYKRGDGVSVRKGAHNQLGHSSLNECDSRRPIVTDG